VIGFVVALLNFLSMGLTFANLASFAGGGAAASAKLQIGFGLGSVGAMVLVMLPLVGVFAALSLALSTYAASYKEGQSYLTPLMLVGMLPAMASALPGMELTPGNCLIPIVGTSLLFRNLLSGAAEVHQVVIVTVSNFAFAWLAVRWVATLYDREDVLMRPAAADDGGLLGRLSGSKKDVSAEDAWEKLPEALRPGPQLPNTPQVAVALGLAFLGIWVVGLQLQSSSLLLGLFGTPLFLGLVAGVGYAWLLRCDLRLTFSLSRPAVLALVGAVLGGIALFVLNLSLLPYLGGLAPPVEGKEMEKLMKHMQELNSLSLPVLLLAIAFLPAVSEELLFRGFVFRGLEKDMGTITAVIASSLLFGLMHFNAQKIVPTAIVGFASVALLLRTGSIFPGMLLHFVNNSLGLLLQRFSLKLLEWELLVIVPSEDGGAPGFELSGILEFVGLASFVGFVVLLWLVGRGATASKESV
jgi:sodium transport system permease protein